MAIRTLVNWFELIKAIWQKPRTSRTIALVLMLCFLVSAAGIICNKLGLLPDALRSVVPTDPFAAIRLAFSLILAVEVLELIFALSDSVSLAVGKQMEIMALILLRESFTDISLLQGEVNLDRDWLILLQIGITAVAGLLLFVFRVIFTRWHYVHSYGNMRGYVNVKKCISLFLLVIFFGALIYDAYTVVGLGRRTSFFRIFYTALIFTDIFLVLAGQYFTPSFQATFRNSGFAVSTLLMRIALGAPHHVGAMLCIFAGAYLLALSWSLSRFSGLNTSPESGQEH